jgi:transposase
MKKQSRRRFSAEFRAQAVELVGLGKPVPEVAQELGIGTSILYRWVQKTSPAARRGSKGLRAVGEEAAVDELRRLRRQVGDLKLENDILKKAAVILGTAPQPRPAK